jgi:hypothetical protein
MPIDVPMAALAMDGARVSWYQRDSNAKPRVP